MSEPYKAYPLTISQWWVDHDGDLTFIILKGGEPYAQGYMSPDGEWAIYFTNGSVPSITEQSVLKAICARHVISQLAAGGMS